MIFVDLVVKKKAVMSLPQTDGEHNYVFVRCPGCSISYISYEVTPHLTQDKNDGCGIHLNEFLEKTNTYMLESN